MKSGPSSGGPRGLITAVFEVSYHDADGEIHRDMLERRPPWSDSLSQELQHDTELQGTQRVWQMLLRKVHGAFKISLLILSGMGSADRLCTSDNSGVRPPLGYEPARLSSMRLALASATCAEAGEKTGTSSSRGAMAFPQAYRGVTLKKKREKRERIDCLALLNVSRTMSKFTSKFTVARMWKRLEEGAVL